MRIKVNASVPDDLSVNGKALAPSTEYDVSEHEGASVIRLGYATEVKAIPAPVAATPKAAPAKRAAKKKRG